MASTTDSVMQPFLAANMLQEAFDAACKQGRTAIVAQVAGLDLNDAQKMKVLHYDRLTFEKDSDVYFYRRVTTALFIVQATCGAVVPILIPFGQTYNEEAKDLLGWHTDNFGEVILVTAVCFSLLSSICLVIERAGKFSKLAFAYNNEQERKICALDRFIALGGHYAKFSNHKEAYPSFVDEMCNIFSGNSRACIFGGSAIQSGGGTGGDDGGEAAPRTLLTSNSPLKKRLDASETP